MTWTQVKSWRLHTNMSSSYKQLLSYLCNETPGHLPTNMSAAVPKCICDTDSGQGDLTLAVTRITVFILVLLAISAGWPLYKGVYRTLQKRRSVRLF